MEIGVIVIFGLNMANRTVKLDFLPTAAHDEYKLSPGGPGDGNLSSRYIELNGKLLSLDDGWKVPKLSDLRRPVNDLKLGPYEMAFWLYQGSPNVKNNICSES